MSITRYMGPIVASGATGSTVGSAYDYNDSSGPSVFAHGSALGDNRYGTQGGGDITAAIPGWYATGNIYAIDAAPATLSATNIAAAQVPVAGTALTLAGASTGITVLSSAFSLFGGAGVVPSGSLVMDGNPATISIAAQGGGVSVYDPRTAICRTLRFTSAGNDSAATAAIVGYDFYGNIVHETVTLTSGSIATSKKALKFVTSITPAGTLSGSNLSVGTSDIYGFPLASWEFQTMVIYWNATLISASTGYLAAVTTTPSATTGDVRGTYAVQSASDGSKKLQVFMTPMPWKSTSTGLFGVTQF
jgi:hypothetical protein